MDLTQALAAIVGPAHLLQGPDAAPWARDWTGGYRGQPLAVARPGSTAEVSQILRIAHDARLPVVPASGRTGLTGAAHAPGALVLSLDRMNRIRALKPGPRLAIAEAGVILERLHEAAAAHDLQFPLTFGAKGSAMVGGALSTNAGGSNVLRHGSARDQVLGLEVVLASGRVLDLMAELHKDNSGYALRHLFVGAEGTLGVITAAVLKLVPRPRAHATAMIAVPSVAAALDLLSRLQETTGGGVEAFEYMPRAFIAAHLTQTPGARPPFDSPHEHTILLEVGSTAPRDARPGPDGATPLMSLVEGALAEALVRGQVLDAVLAQNEAQRRAMWERRESAARITFTRPAWVDTDVALPLDRLEEFLATVRRRLAEIDPGADDMVVAHLGDGNVHYTAYPTRGDTDHLAAIRALVDATATALDGSFSAEHGVGLSKLASMRAHKDPVALDTMRALKAALDPHGILNPGKVLPAP
ncbi:FAD-binding oxidoreductase [Rubellimicrobium aerolatum]|uniref:FAD-binding oxidoreductase n=1 Tax=Rubellimicrobium aerolatum TaxID=490979 RepID=A0ABW0SEX3_9RHOB|nr:FAD-binding oxidoreductase [Rubellimicrobium aerolatum]MBP1806500.1 FAD/FMN-containing dehydrogenase [Rubellimicrobium aerolatum]